MAKRKAAEPRPTRKQLSRREREERQRRMILLGAGVIFLLIVGILGGGFYELKFRAPASPVAVVNGGSIRTDAYQDRVRFERLLFDTYRQRMESQLSQLDPNDETEAALASLFQQEIEMIEAQRAQLPSQVLDTMIEEELIRQEAERQGLTVSEEEVERAIEEGFGYQREPAVPPELTPTPTITATESITPTPTIPLMTEGEFKQAYEAYLEVLKRAGLSEPFYREVVRGSLVRSKLWGAIGQEVPTREEQVHVRHIVVETEEEAEALRERLEAGEDFAVLAQELSIDEATKEEGGEMGWVAFDKQDISFSAMVFQLEVGEISPVIETAQGYEILKLEGKEEERELDPAMLEVRKGEAFTQWLTDAENEAEIERYWSEDKVPAG